MWTETNLIHKPRPSRKDVKLTRWTEERVAKLVEMWGRGDPIKVIADYFGVTDKAIEAKRAGLRLAPRYLSSASHKTYAYRLPRVTAKTRANAARSSKIAMANAYSGFEHKSLITFLPESPKLEAWFKQHVAEIRIERSNQARVV